MAIKTTTATASTTTTRPKALAQSVLAAALLVPGVVLAVFAWSQFRDGVAVDSAIPVPVYMVAQIAMPKSAYMGAAAALERANPRDGRAALLAAEAMMHAGAPVSATVSVIREGLERQPASTRGWTLLAGALYPAEKENAARALTQALVLAPRDYWLVGPRSRNAALLWPQLDSDTRAMAIAQTRLLWSEPQLHGELRKLLRSRDGVQLASRAFGPEEIRAVNRWHARELRRSPPP
jgi:hypothetical protein